MYTFGLEWIGKKEFSERVFLTTFYAYTDFSLRSRELSSLTLSWTFNNLAARVNYWQFSVTFSWTFNHLLGDINIDIDDFLLSFQFNYCKTFILQKLIKYDISLQYYKLIEMIGSVIYYLGWCMRFNHIFMFFTFRFHFIRMIHFSSVDYVRSFSGILRVHYMCRDWVTFGWFFNVLRKEFFCLSFYFFYNIDPLLVLVGPRSPKTRS